MKTVNIGELKNQLSGYLQYVKNGEEIVIRDRTVPVARILPLQHGSGWDQEAQLVASGALKMPEEDIDWDQFFLLLQAMSHKRLPLKSRSIAGEIVDACLLGYKRTGAPVRSATAKPRSPAAA